MKYVVLLLTLLFASLAASAQTAPYVFGGLGIQGGGQQSLSGVGGAGFESDTKPAVFNIEGTYNAAHKNANSGGGNSGYYLRGSSDVYGRVGTFLLGGGASWSETHTDLYVKQAWHPSFGGGKDFSNIRVLASYFLPGTDKVNGAQGTRFTVYFPKPTETRHWFLRYVLEVYSFHGTVDSPNPVTAAAERKLGAGVTGASEFTFGWRF